MRISSLPQLYTPVLMPPMPTTGNYLTRTHVLVATIFALAVICSCKSPPKQSKAEVISQIVAEDQALHARVFPPASKEVITPQMLAARIGDYAKGLRNIDMTAAPKDFQIAYLEHIQAWESLGWEVQRKPDSGGLQILLGFMGIASGAPEMGAPTLFDGLSKRAQSQSQLDAVKDAAWRRINETWNKIEIIALQNGATLKKT